MLAPRLMIWGLALCLLLPMGYWLYRALLVARDEYIEFDSIAAMSRLQGRPLLLIGGANDPAVAPAMLERLHAVTPGSELWIVSGAGHVGRSQEHVKEVLERHLMTWMTGGP